MIRNYDIPPGDNGATFIHVKPCVFIPVKKNERKECIDMIQKHFPKIDLTIEEKSVSETKSLGDGLLSFNCMLGKFQVYTMMKL